MQELLRANIKRWPSSVSEDGLAISVWMEDFSLQRNGYRRCFELKFFDERSAQYFFEEFTQALPVGSLKGPSYYEMRHGKEIESEEDKCENEEEDNWNESEKVMKKGQTAAETCPLESDGGDYEPTQQEVDEFFLQLEEENIGESQNLFHPIPQNW